MRFYANPFTTTVAAISFLSFFECCMYISLSSSSALQINHLSSFPEKRSRLDYHHPNEQRMNSFSFFLFDVVISIPDDCKLIEGSWNKQIRQKLKLHGKRKGF